MTRVPNKLQNLTFSVFLAIMIGWILVVGQYLLLPVFLAIISVYILVSASERLGKVSITRHLSERFRRLIVLIGFIVIIMIFAGVVISTADQMSSALPKYQANLERMIFDFSAILGIEKSPDWQAIRAATIGKLDIPSVIGVILGSAMSLVSSIFIIIIYATFLLAERGVFAGKLAVALPSKGAEQIEEMVTEINGKIGSYLSVKTLVGYRLKTGQN